MPSLASNVAVDQMPRAHQVMAQFDLIFSLQQRYCGFRSLIQYFDRLYQRASVDIEQILVVGDEQCPFSFHNWVAD